MNKSIRTTMRLSRTFSDILRPLGTFGANPEDSLTGLKH